MKDETTQPTRISKDEYKRFKQFVQDTHGQTRGHLKTEIENALREYRQPDNTAEPLQRIENDIATIKAQIAQVESDGGTVAVSDGSHARTPNEKPEPNAPRSKKVEWVVNQKYDRERGSATVSDIVDSVKMEYGFQDRTAEKYIQSVIDELDAKRHPNNDKIVVWGKEIQRLKERLSEDTDE